MKRRQHWDTELEQSVSAILFDCYNNGVSEEQVYQAIAAVEDWVLSSPIFDLYLSRKHAPDKAAIQRVRELCDGADQHRPRIDGYLINRTVPVKDIRRALEGDSDE